MKTPEELAQRLSRQWEQADLREQRLLDGEDAWPVSFSIGKPSPGLVANDLDALKRHVERWRKVTTGTVLWEPVSYRATAGPVEMPAHWQLDDASQWIAACADRKVRGEFETLRNLIAQTDPCFHALLVRRRSLWRGRPEVEVVQAARLALELAPGCAEGRPLRTLPLAHIDTKFFERNERLVIALLDVRFDGEVSPLGLETFLGAASERDHWLLVIDLDGSLLPFEKLRVRTSELRDRELPGSRLLIVENESCQHHLPALPGTVAVLGAGFDLSWTDAPWLRAKQVAYWGDLDTWGLAFLARARAAVPHLEALLMSEQIYDQFGHSAVPEPVPAGCDPPPDLRGPEQALYRRLLAEPRGRLEQEFLPVGFVRDELRRWAEESSPHNRA